MDAIGQAESATFDGFSLQVQGLPLCTSYPAAAADVVRVPFELCVVLDRSGSMAGAKLSAAKEAVHNIIDALAEGDLLHLVAYDTRAEIVLQGVTSAHAAE